ncbi:MAG: Gfo/Idh/MocA family oxidoreductase [Chloroflexota bacterium]|nr:MAG: Gfo/Idh/MocA family oxidoreductase [Chloroflexota bacterium]
MRRKKNPSPPLKWGLLSTARINRALIEPLRGSERNELQAVASRSEVRAQVYAAEREIPKAYGSYQAMLDDPEIDVIYNSLPNSLHSKWSIRALQAGKHVLCEKPLATTLEEVDEMRAAVEATGNFLAEAFMYRHHPQTRKVKELVDSGMLGRLRLIKGEFTFNIDDESNVRLKPELGGGSIWDVGCYPISYTRFIMGKNPEEVFGWQHVGDSGVDEVFTGQLRFEGDVFAQFDSGFRSPYRSRMEIVGSDATLIIPHPFNPGLEVDIQVWRGEESETLQMPSQELYIGEVEDIADAVLLDRSPGISLEDSRGNVEVILALLSSARSGKPLKLE